MTCVPNRIMSRTLVTVLPHPTLHLQRVDQLPNMMSSSRPRRSKNTSRKRTENRRAPPVEQVSSKLTEDSKEIIIRPAPLDEGEDADDTVAPITMQIKQEKIDDPVVEQARAHARISVERKITDVTIKSEPEQNEHKTNEIPLVKRTRSNISELNTAEGTRRKRKAREEILQSEKKLKQDNIPTFVSTEDQRRPVDPECEELQGIASIHIESKSSFS